MSGILTLTLGILAFILAVAVIVFGAMFFLFRRSNSLLMIEPNSSLALLLGSHQYHYRVNAYAETSDHRYVMVCAFLSSASRGLSRDGRLAIRDGFEDCLKKSLQDLMAADFYGVQEKLEHKWFECLERLCLVHGIVESKINLRTQIDYRLNSVTCDCRLVAKIS